MSKDPRIVDFLTHIVEAIARIGEYTANASFEEFSRSHLIQDAVIRNMEIIGEACNNIRKRDPDYVKLHPSIPWGSAIGMRNVLTHGYFKVDVAAVWQTIRQDLPSLDQQIRQLLADSVLVSGNP